MWLNTCSKLIAYSADELYTIRKKSEEPLREYVGLFNHKYSHCFEADDKTALRAFTAGMHECFFKYMINVHTGNTYSEVMMQAYNHAFVEAMTYQGNPHKVNSYKQVGNECQVLPSEKILAIQTLITSHPAPLSKLPGDQAYSSFGKRKNFYSEQASYNKRNKGSYRDNQGWTYLQLL